MGNFPQSPLDKVLTKVFQNYEKISAFKIKVLVTCPAFRMKREITHKNGTLYFSRWSRKGYAVFAALGRNVCISAVPLSICESALLKSARKGIVVSDACCQEESRPEDENEHRKPHCRQGMKRGEVCTDGNRNEQKKQKDTGDVLLGRISLF